jgi:ABC-2 type transport system ATP-binding protein
MEAVLETHGLRKVFGELAAVDGIDLAVPRGSFYGFLGPNGAGKSTTIKCLTGLLRPTAGTMRILGIDPLADVGKTLEAIFLELVGAEQARAPALGWLAG